MADLRAKRICAGAIIILASVATMLVLAGFAEYDMFMINGEASQYEPTSFLFAVAHMKIRYEDKDATARRRQKAEENLRMLEKRSGLTAWEQRAEEEKWIEGKRVAYGYLPFANVFAFGMAGIGIGAILLILGLTTQRGVGSRWSLVRGGMTAAQVCKTLGDPSYKQMDVHHGVECPAWHYSFPSGSEGIVRFDSETEKVKSLTRPRS